MEKKTKIYLIRHSEQLKINNPSVKHENAQINNEKIESVENREKAEKEIAKNKYKNRIR